MSPIPALTAPPRGFTLAGDRPLTHPSVAAFKRLVLQQLPPLRAALAVEDRRPKMPPPWPEPEK